MEKPFFTPKGLKKIDLRTSKVKIWIIIITNVHLAGKIISVIIKNLSDYQIFRRKFQQKQFSTPLYSKDDNCVRLRNEEYRVGCAVFLKADVYLFPKNDVILNEETVSVFLLSMPTFFKIYFLFIFLEGK